MDAHGLSRNEFLRRRFEAERSGDGSRLTVADLRRAAEAAQDLNDPDVMEAVGR